MITEKGWVKVYCFFGQTEGETWGRICRAVDVRTVEKTLRKAIITPIDGTDEGLARRGPSSTLWHHGCIDLEAEGL
jgi:hypothetical protein